MPERNTDSTSVYSGPPAASQEAHVDDHSLKPLNDETYRGTRLLTNAARHSPGLHDPRTNRHSFQALVDDNTQNHPPRPSRSDLHTVELQNVMENSIISSNNITPTQSMYFFEHLKTDSIFSNTRISALVGPLDVSKEGWDYVRSISKDAFKALALQHRPPNATSAQVLEFSEGVHNYAATIKYDDGSKVCVRVPCCGSKKWWGEDGITTLRNTVETMQFIRARTRMRIPEVIAFDLYMDNIISAPFVIMTCVEGKSVDDLWWDHDYMDETKDYTTVSEELEQRRQALLKSIAFQVAELRHLKFNQLGLLRLNDGNVYDEEIIMASSCIPFASIMDDDENYEDVEGADKTPKDRPADSEPEMGPYTSSHTKLIEALEAWYIEALVEVAKTNVFNDIASCPQAFTVQALYQLYSMLIEYFPYGPSSSDELTASETFVLSQTDFSPQNIYVDGEYNITGFIDWDFSDTKPRYIGWARAPIWLCGDWEFGRGDNEGRFAWPAPGVSVSPDLTKYRQDYTRYLMQACGQDSDDWKYTMKSPIFDAIFEAIGNTEEMKNLLLQILDNSISRVRWFDHLCNIGHKGFSPGQEVWYRNHFENFFECNAAVVKRDLMGGNDMREPDPFAEQKEEQIKLQLAVNKTQKELLDICKEFQAAHENLIRDQKELIQEQRVQISEQSAKIKDRDEQIKELQEALLRAQPQEILSKDQALILNPLVKFFTSPEQTERIGPALATINDLSNTQSTNPYDSEPPLSVVASTTPDTDMKRRSWMDKIRYLFKPLGVSKFQSKGLVVRYGSWRRKRRTSYDF